MPDTHSGEEFIQFCRRRHEWAVSGSSGGYSVTIPKDSAYNRSTGDSKDDISIKGDKRAVFEAMKAEEVESFLDSEPAEDAVASEKYENGKRRSIYGVGLKHYTICSYVTHGFEEAMNKVQGFEKGLSGIKEFAAQQKRAAICADPNQECTMFDYADFNAQHTPRAMAIVVEAMIEVGKSRNYPTDWLKAAEWLRQSKYNMWFTCPLDDKKHIVKQGLFSGVRTTDFDNSNLNKAYFEVTKDLVSEKYSCNPHNLYHVHQGDDVWVSNTKRHWAALIYYQLAANGAVLRAKKQMLGKHFGEYLRVLYHKDGGTGYAVRAIVNYILRPIQNKKIDDVAAMCQSLHSTYQVLQRRGMTQHFLNDLYDTDLMYWATIKAHPTDKKPISLPNWVIQVDSTKGGFGCHRPGQIMMSNIHIPETPRLKMLERPKTHKLPQHMTNEWISYVSQKLPSSSRAIQSNSIRQALFQTNYYKVLSSIGYGFDVDRYKKDWQIYLRQNKSLGATKTSVNPKYFHIIQFTSLNDFDRLTYEFTHNSIIASDVTHQIKLLQTNIQSSVYDTTMRDNNIKTMLEKLFIHSVFKDITMTATALGLDKALAATWIFEHCLSSDQAQNPDMILILNMLQQPHGERLIDFMFRNSFGSFDILLGFMSPNIILECVRMVKESMVLSYRDIRFKDAEFYSVSFNARCLQLLKLIVKQVIYTKPILY